MSKAAWASAGVISRSPVTSAHLAQKVADMDLLAFIVIAVSLLNR
jgi:hypothetical protein